jgi:hypothetical protein
MIVRKKWKKWKKSMQRTPCRLYKVHFDQVECSGVNSRHREKKKKEGYGWGLLVTV